VWFPICHCLPAAEGASGLQSCSSGPQLLRSNTTKSCVKSYLHANATGCFRPFRSGIALRLSTADPGAVSMWSQQVHHASRTQSRALSRALGTHEIGGPIRSEFLGKYDRKSRSWRTAQRSLFRERGPVSWRELSFAGTMRSGRLYRQKRLEPRTYADVSGFSSSVPTPTKGDSKASRRLSLEGDKFGDKSHPGQTLTDYALRNPLVFAGKLPTPTRSRYGSNRSPSPGGSVRPSLSTLARFDTPTVKDSNNSPTDSQFRRNSPGLNAQVVGRNGGGRVNPEFVEWLMAWPITGSGLKPLDLRGYRQWLRLHSVYCSDDISIAEDDDDE